MKITPTKFFNKSTLFLTKNGFAREFSNNEIKNLMSSGMAVALICDCKKDDCSGFKLGSCQLCGRTKDISHTKYKEPHILIKISEFGYWEVTR